MQCELFHCAAHLAGQVISKLKPEDMHKPTPCAEWDVEALTNHIVNEVAWIKPLLDGKTIAEVGTALDGDLLGGDPAAAWNKYIKEAMDTAVATPPEAITHLSYADKPAGAYLREVGADVLVHGWDLAKAIGAEYKLDEAMALDAVEAMKDVMEDARGAGMIGKALEVADDANEVEKMLALYGRKADWAA